MNLERHIWEGWRAIDFIEDIEHSFDTIMQGHSWQKPFKDAEEIKKWCMENQPYYKKHIPEVYNYFLIKANLK